MYITDDFGEQVAVPHDEVGDCCDMFEMRARLAHIERRMGNGSSRMARIENDVSSVRGDLSENTDMTKSMVSSMADILAFFTAMKGAFRVLNWIGRVAKPVAAIGAMVAALITAYTAWRAGQ